MLVRCPTCDTVYRVDSSVPVIPGQAVHCGACGADFELSAHIIRRSPLPGVASAVSLAEPVVVKARPLPYSATAAPVTRPVSGQRISALANGRGSPTLGPDPASSEAAAVLSPPSAIPADAPPAEWRATPPGEIPTDAVDARWSLGTSPPPAASVADRTGSPSSADHPADQRSEPQAVSSIESPPHSTAAAPDQRPADRQEIETPVSNQDAPTPGADRAMSEAAVPTTPPLATPADAAPDEWRAIPPGESPSDAVDTRWSLGALRRSAADATDEEARPASSTNDSVEIEPGIAESGSVEATEKTPEMADSAPSEAVEAVATSAPAVTIRPDKSADITGPLGVTQAQPPEKPAEVAQAQQLQQPQIDTASRPSPLKRLLSGNPALSSAATRLPDPPPRKAPSPWQRPPDQPSSSAIQTPVSPAITQPPAAPSSSAPHARAPSTPGGSLTSAALPASASPEPLRGATVQPVPATDARWSIAPPPAVIDDPLATKDVSAIPEVAPAEQAKRFSLQAGTGRSSTAEPVSTVVGTRQREDASSRRRSEPTVSDLPSDLVAAGGASPRLDVARPVPSTPGWSRPRSLVSRIDTIGWWQSLAAVVLVAVLAVQLIYAQRLSLADSERGRPLAEAVCVWLGCSLPLPHAEGRVRLLRGTVTEHPEEALALQLSALLVNESSVRAAYPLLRLRLLDDAQRVSAERRFHPSEYLEEADHVLWRDGLAPGQSVSARLAIVAPATGSDQFLIDLQR